MIAYGNTPLWRLTSQGGLNAPCPVYAKLEGMNPTGSMKIRSAMRIVHSGGLTPGATIIESTSGNMGVALALVALKEFLNCVLVVDPKLSPWHRQEMLKYGAELVEVTEVDDTGGWLKTRLAKVKELCEEHPDWFWVNQYESYWNQEAFKDLGYEIVDQLGLQFDKPSKVKLLWLFASVSTGGSLSGVARILKGPSYHYSVPYSNDVQVVAVDAVGSAIFGGPAKKRYLNGIGSSLSNPPNLDRSLIDQVYMVGDAEAFKMCYRLRDDGLWVGGSSGAVTSAIIARQSWFKEDDLVIGIFPDDGKIYEETLYSESWLAERGFDIHEMVGTKL